MITSTTTARERVEALVRQFDGGHILPGDELSRGAVREFLRWIVLASDNFDGWRQVPLIWLEKKKDGGEEE